MATSGQILKAKQVVQTVNSNLPCTVYEYLGGGTQGEVYRVKVEGEALALKWYYPTFATTEQRKTLETLILKDPPTSKFLWPLELTAAKDVPGFGYLMPLREPRYKEIKDLMKRRIEPTFRVLARAGRQLADSYLQLHAKGLCYRDISWGNVFFDPYTGDVLICDNDNVSVDMVPVKSVLGTPGFMAPEIVRGEAVPSTQTDLHSLAVLLFYMLMVSHPLNGKKEASIRCFDLPAMNKIYGKEPVFIFDPQDDSNRPVKGIHDNANVFWPLYPQFLQDLFMRAFTKGLHDPNRRVREGEWRQAMTTLEDWIVFCPVCGRENFYIPGEHRTGGDHLPICWNCRKKVPYPYHICLGRSIVMLNHDTRLYPHHIDSQRLYDFSNPVAEVVQHPDKKIWGLKNLSNEKWVITGTDGKIKDIDPGRSATLSPGVRFNFGGIEGEIQY